MKKTYEEELKAIACDIWDHPEPAFQEFYSCKRQADYLRDKGFEVTENIVGIETAYIAKYGSGKPVIALLGEYDALYGLGQEANVPKKRPNGQEMGHGCGHHLLGTGCVGAGLLIKDWLDEKKCSGTILVMGCPAEEAGSGKAYMARDGVFDDVDIALAWHPSDITQVGTGSSQSCIAAYFRFFGKASHAAGDPELGRSALDAVELMDIGVNYMREHMPSTDRVHYAITNAGGKSPNVVQAEAEVYYFIRSITNSRCQALYDRVINIAKGAALMTETRMEIHFDEALSNTLPNYVLEDLVEQCFDEAGMVEYTPEDFAYAQQFKEVGEPVTKDMIAASVTNKDELFENMKNSPLNTVFVRNKHSEDCSMGSTDVGDVSWVVPTATFNVASYSYGTPGHSWQLVAQGKSDVAMKSVYKAAEVLALASEKIFEDQSWIERAKDEFEKRTADEPYKCLIPKNVKPHVSGDC